MNREPNIPVEKPGDISTSQMLQLSNTLTATPSQKDRLTSRMQLIDGLMADGGKLPNEPVLLWRESDRIVKHVVIYQGLVVGRKVPAPGLSLGDDALLSRSHFQILLDGEHFRIEDLKSKNGTFINRIENRVDAKILRDGDIILAGNHMFAFLDQRKTS